MILILEFEDGGEQPFGIGDTVQSLIRAIERNEVSRIVVGETKDRKVVWEKQFSLITSITVKPVVSIPS